MNHPALSARRRCRRHLLVPVLLLSTVLLGASACTSGDAPAATVTVPGFLGSAGAPQANKAEPTTPPAEAAAASGAEINSCSVLKAAEVKGWIGSNSGPKGGGNECVWTNEQNYYSVTVHIGGAGTAANGELPDPLPGASIEAGPDGIRFTSGEEADFLIGDRACFAQLVTLSDDLDKANMVKLIGLVRSRVKS